MLERAATVPAHGVGSGCVLFVDGGSKVVSGGSDRSLRLFSSSLVRGRKADTAELKSSRGHDLPITALALHGQRLATGSEDQKVRLVDADSLEVGSVVFRSTLGVCHLEFSPDGAWLAVAAQDGDVHLVNVADTTRTIVLEGHTSIVKSVAFSPLDARIVVTSGADGTVRVWKLAFASAPLETGEADASDADKDSFECVKILRDTIDRIPTDSGLLSRIAWHPSGKYFAVCGKRKEIVFIKNGTWDILYRIRGHDDHSILTFSPNGMYILSAGGSGIVSIWRHESDRDQPIVSEKHSSVVTGVQWHPKANDLVMIDYSGQIVYIEKAVPYEHPHPVTGENRAGGLGASKGTLAGGSAISQSTAKELESLFADLGAKYDDGDDKHRRRTSSRHAVDSDNLESLVEARASRTSRSSKRSHVADAGGGDDEADDDGDDYDDIRDFVVDDDGAGYTEDLDKPEGLQRYHQRSRETALREIERDTMATGRRAFGHAFAAPVVAEIQPAFQPGSTPERGNKRYLTFNLVGQVSSISGGDATATINVDYHDKSMRPFHFADHYLYTMAALNESGAAFASAACSTTPSTVFFRPSDSWATKGQWTIQLGADESATAVALTRTAIVVATDMHYLRLFSYGGVQTQLRSVPGPVLSMAGQGNMLFVVYHDGGVFHGNQSLSYLLLDSDKRATVLQGRLPTSPSSTLDWVGFSDTNIPLTYDSRGILRGLFAHDDAAWVPLLDARIVRGDKQDHYWAVGLADDKFMCVVCKSGDKMPAVGKVLVNEVPLQAPFAQLDVPSAQMEEQWFLKSLMMGHTMARDPVMRAVLASAGSAQIFDGDDDALEPEALNTPDDPYYRNKTALDKIVLQLVHAACQAERVQRALDLCSVLYSNKSLEGAIKLAVHLHLPALAERINALKEARYVLEKQRKQRADRRRIEARYGRSAFDRADDGDYERGDESVTTAGTHAARMNGRPREAADRGVVSGHSFAAAAAERRELLGKLKVAGAGGSVPAARSRPAEPSDTESLVSRSDLLADSDPAPPIQTHTEPAAPPARKLGNPFAIGADAAKPAVGREAAAVSASRQGLFDSLARATAQKDQEARDKKAALETVPAKRKQTTLFGMQPKAPDAVAAEKKPKKARGSGTPGQDEGAAEESDARPSIGTSSKVPSPLTLDKFASQTSKQRDDVASVLDKDTAADAAVIDKENADAGNTEPQDEEKMRRAAEKGKAPANPSTSLRSFAFVR